jgi:flagellar assembly protein FliH
MSPETFVRREIPRLSAPADGRERERARRQGHALGYAEGLRIAAQEARAEAERAEAERRAAVAHDAAAASRARAAVEEAAASLRERTGRIAEVAEERIWALAVELAETILECELSDRVRAARTALTRAENAVAAAETDAVVILSDADAETLDRLGERPQGIAVEASGALASGDAVVHVPDGEVDLRVAAALARARAALAEAAS